MQERSIEEIVKSKTKIESQEITSQDSHPQTKVAKMEATRKSRQLEIYQTNDRLDCPILAQLHLYKEVASIQTTQTAFQISSREILHKGVILL